MPEFKRVATISEIPSGRAHMYDLDGHYIAICNQEGEITAVSGVCTHANVEMDDCDLEDGCIVCPLHFASFDARTGDPMDPPAYEPLKVYGVKIEGEDILVDVG